MSERRAFPRWAVALNCQTNGKAGSVPGVINELSENGLGLASERVSEVGEELGVEWRLEPDDDQLQVQCVVRDVNPVRIGVEFLNLSRACRLRIVRFITKQ